MSNDNNPNSPSAVEAAIAQKNAEIDRMVTASREREDARSYSAQPTQPQTGSVHLTAYGADNVHVSASPDYVPAANDQTAPLDEYAALSSLNALNREIGYAVARLEEGHHDPATGQKVFRLNGSERASLERWVAGMRLNTLPDAETKVEAARRYSAQKAQEQAALHQAMIAREHYLNAEAAKLVDQQEIEERAARMRRNLRS